MIKISQIKQTIYAEMLELEYNASLGKYNNLTICKHRSKGHMAYWEMQMLLREKLDTIGGIHKALEELINEEKIEKTEEGLYKIKK